ncbi:MAG: hypothetical protein AAFV69_02645 [Pseudomonadota bacterium]
MDTTPEVYGIFADNCIAMVNTAPNAANIDLQSYLDASGRLTANGFVYPGSRTQFDVPYTITGTGEDDEIRGLSYDDLFNGSGGSDEIFGFQISGERIRDHQDMVSYENLTDSINLDLDPDAMLLASKSTGQDELHGIEKFRLTSNNDVVLISENTVVNSNIPLRHIDAGRGLDLIDLSPLGEDFRIDQTKTYD